jgi:hypothetical protein
MIGKIMIGQLIPVMGVLVTGLIIKALPKTMTV